MEPSLKALGVFVDVNCGPVERDCGRGPVVREDVSFWDKVLALDEDLESDRSLLDWPYVHLYVPRRYHPIISMLRSQELRCVRDTVKGFFASLHPDEEAKHFVDGLFAYVTRCRRRSAAACLRLCSTAIEISGSVRTLSHARLRLSRLLTLCPLCTELRQYVLERVEESTWPQKEAATAFAFERTATSAIRSETCVRR